MDTRSRGNDSGSVLGEGVFALVWGAWLGLLAGTLDGVREVLAHGYLASGLTLNAVSVLAGAIRREMVAAIVLLAAALWILRLLRPIPVRVLRVALLLALAVLVLIVGIRLNLEDDWWIEEWEVWAAFVALALVGSGEFLRLPRLRPVSIVVPGLVLAVLVASEARMTSARRAQRQERPNVLLLVVDALRPDHMGLHGYERETTATMDALAAAGLWFEHAVSPSNKTRTTMPSMWTGLYPSRHGVLSTKDIFSARFTTAAELLREAGYRTAAFCPNPNLDRTVGHAQGWDRYVDRMLRPIGGKKPKWLKFETATRINELALDWIDEDPAAPFLAWLHYRDVHGPYVPPPPYDAMFRSATSRPLTAMEVDTRNRYLNLEGDGNDLQYYLDRYDGEIRYTDDRISELLSALDARGLRERTVVVLTADHGEAFLDHGWWNHGGGLYQEESHVPLIIAGPGIHGPKVSRPVSTLDLFPTLLDLAGVSIPPNDGHSLVPDLTGAENTAPDRPVYTEGSSRGGNRQWAVRDGHWKLIIDDDAGSIELFDLARDPRETEDRFDTEPLVAERLLTLLRAFIEDVGSSLPQTAAAEDIDPELRQRLESLGYVDPE